MDKGFLNRKTTSKKVVDNDLVVTGSVLGDLAGKVKNIDGKILGKDGKPMMARRCVRNPDVMKESVGGDVRLADDVVEQASHTGERSILDDQQVCIDRKAVNRPDLGPRNTMVSDTSRCTNVAPIELNKSSTVTLPKAALDEVLESGPWRIQLVPFVLKIWKPNTLNLKENVSCVPLWVKIHNVPIVAYSKVRLDLISAKVGKLMRLDAHTNFICLNSWGVVSIQDPVEVSAKVPLEIRLIHDIPLEDGKKKIKKTPLVDLKIQAHVKKTTTVCMPIGNKDKGNTDQFEEYPSSYEEFCDQFDFKVKGRGRN
ncbi:zinc knuckle CX2CX4HX4C containing protein [Tanacetum coccineum]